MWCIFRFVPLLCVLCCTRRNRIQLIFNHILIVVVFYSLWLFFILTMMFCHSIHIRNDSFYLGADLCVSFVGFFLQVLKHLNQNTLHDMIQSFVLPFFFVPFEWIVLLHMLECIECMKKRTVWIQEPQTRTRRATPNKQWMQIYYEKKILNIRRKTVNCTILTPNHERKSFICTNKKLKVRQYMYWSSAFAA